MVLLKVECASGSALKESRSGNNLLSSLLQLVYRMGGIGRRTPLAMDT
jgi:hypothetical protein